MLNPTGERWEEFCDRLPTEEECEIWEKTKPPRYGLVCGPASGVLWIDIDSDDPKVIDAVKPSPVRKRGRKGESRAFRFNPDIPSCKVAGIIDILAYGRQTVLPPTIHPDTLKPYVWVTPDTLENFSVSDLPEFTVDDLNDLRRALEPEKFEVGDASGVSLQGPFFNDDPKRGCPHGSHDRLKRIVSAVIARGASPDEAVRELLRYDEENHKPVGYFSDDTRSDCFADPVSNALFFYSSNLRTFNRRQVKSGLPPSIPLVSGSELIDVSELKKSVAKAWTPVPWPEPKGLLKDIRDLTLGISERSIPALALGGAISMGSVVIANRLKMGDVWPNVFALNVANTGAGKSFPYITMKRILSPENDLDLLGSGGYRSSASIMKDLVGRRERLDPIDECSSLFDTIKNGGVFQADIIDVLNDLWSAGSSLFIGPESMGREKVSVWHPCVSALMSSNPTGIKNSVTKEFVTKGFIPRFLIFYESEYGSFNENQQWDESLAKRITDVFLQLQKMGNPTNSGRKNLVSPIPNPMEIPSDANALRMLKDYTRECSVEMEQPDQDELTRSFLSRRAQQAKKLALIHGALRDARVSIVDVEWAFATLTAMWHNAGPLLPEMGAENAQETNGMRVLQIIRKEGSVQHSKLIGKTRFLKTSERNEILASYEAEGKIALSFDATRSKIWSLTGK